MKAAPEMTLKNIKAGADHAIGTSEATFKGWQAVDAVLREFGYERTSKIAWEIAPDWNYNVALMTAYEFDSDSEVIVPVLGFGFLREL